MEFGLYRELVRAARPLFEAEDWSRLKSLLREGIAKGAYAKDSHGIDTLDRCIRTGTVIVEKTGLKKASLLTALFDPMIQQGLKGSSMPPKIRVGVLIVPSISISFSSVLYLRRGRP